VSCHESDVHSLICSKYEHYKQSVCRERRSRYALVVSEQFITNLPHIIQVLRVVFLYTLLG
jgi:hypothetical protein